MIPSRGGGSNRGGAGGGRDGRGEGRCGSLLAIIMRTRLIPFSLYLIRSPSLSLSLSLNLSLSRIKVGGE